MNKYLFLNSIIIIIHAKLDLKKPAVSNSSPAAATSFCSFERKTQMSRTCTCQFIIAFLKAQFYHSSVAQHSSVQFSETVFLDH